MRLTVVRTMQLVTISAAFAATAAQAQSSGDSNRSAPPKVGDRAPDFELLALGGDKVRLSTIAKHGPVAVVVLRGYPGYQCPVCSRQVRQFAERGKQFEDAGAEVLMIYPGPAQELAEAGGRVRARTRPPEEFPFAA